ncbi:MAG: prepilin-type N-terminal cleavage/methylation domain-containing protein [Candidatus Buchananbacteria bacterium]|nr:prepilin-type N-terminal cleavage/methylation domain-containing protein [Candidatus Buchananbacteria bacterium]
MNKKGFTLIELLVVIAIIAILSSIAFFQFSSARNKGNNAKIQAEIQQIKTDIELTTNGGTYPATTPSPIPARFRAPACSTGYVYRQVGTGTGYILYAPLCGTPAQFFCVDSTGNSTTTATVAVTATVCQ